MTLKRRKKKNLTCSNVFYLGEFFLATRAYLSPGVSSSLQDASSILWTVTQCLCLSGRDMCDTVLMCEWQRNVLEYSSLKVCVQTIWIPIMALLVEETCDVF